MIFAIEKLQRMGNSKVPIGPFQVDIALRPNKADTGSSGSLENTQKLWERLQPNGDLEAREQALLLKEEALQCEYNLLKQQQAALACEQQRLVLSTQQQAIQAISLKERIEDLLQEQRSSLLDISTSSQSLSLPPETPTVYEADLKALKAQIPDVNLEENEGISVKREMERAEEMVRNREDASKIRLQLTIARNHIIQFKGHLLAKEAEKMAKSVNMSMQALGSDLLFQRSKNRIKEQLLQKMRSAATSPRANIGTKSPFKRWEASSYSYVNSPMRTSIEEVQIRKSLETEDKQERLKLQVNRLEERNKQLSERVTMLQERLDKYKSTDMDLADKRGKVKAGIRRCIAIQNALSKQETALSDREMRISMHEDSLRTALSRTFTGAEAREFLALRAKALTEQQQHLMRDWAFVDLAKTDLAAEKERVMEDSGRLERDKERLGRKWERLDKERKQLDAVRSRLEALLPVLSST